MNHQPPFKAVDDFVKDKDGNKVCMCWGRQGNPKGGEQEAETIAKALNMYHDIKNQVTNSTIWPGTTLQYLLTVPIVKNFVQKYFPNDH